MHEQWLQCCLRMPYEHMAEHCMVGVSHSSRPIHVVVLSRSRRARFSFEQYLQPEHACVLHGWTERS